MLNTPTSPQTLADFTSAPKSLGAYDSDGAAPLLKASGLASFSEGSTLGRIVAHKQGELRSHYKAGADTLFKADLPVSTKSFKDALSTKGPNYIFEIKRASPSKGDIAPDIDLSGITALYDEKADCISVLTDAHFFGGSFDVLKGVTAKTSNPVLCKDFFIDPLQIYMARNAGADAILLMLSVLTDEAYTLLSAVAKSLEMDVLTEVHDEAELTRGIALKAEIIGVNNRNLNDLSINLETTKQLAPKIPEGTVIISESGIETREDILDLSGYVNGFLIGSSIMGAPSPRQKINDITLGQVKVCGLTRVEDAQKAHQLGATYGGLIFAEKSPRNVSLDQALAISKSTPLNYVGVFVDEALETVAANAKALGLSAVQLHGSEDETYRRTLKALLPQETAIWQAVRVKDKATSLPKGADRVLFDTYHPSLAGGTGEAFNWDTLNKSDDFILAGGLTADNITEALKTGANILDVNSGVETAPGVKCSTKMTALFSNLKKFKSSLDVANLGGAK